MGDGVDGALQPSSDKLTLQLAMVLLVYTLQPSFDIQEPDNSK